MSCGGKGPKEKNAKREKCMDNANVIKDIMTNGYVQIVLTLIALYLAKMVFKR